MMITHKLFLVGCTTSNQELPRDHEEAIESLSIEIESLSNEINDLLDEKAKFI